MSHFCVLVVGDDIESILEPYDETVDSEPYIDKTSDEVSKEFSEQQQHCFEQISSGKDLGAFETQTISMKKVTSEWWYEWCGQELDERGNALSTYNPGPQYDYYQVGGRWMGQLILKKGKRGSLGSPGVFGNAPKFDADSALIKDVDWVAMKKSAEIDVGGVWDRLFNPSEDPVYRPEYIESEKSKHLTLYGGREEYIRRRGYWTTYALVTEHEWIAPGKIGSFGTSSDKHKDRDDYTKKFVDLLKSLDPNTTITVVDCHI